MVNAEEFISRLKEIITYNELSSSGFAEKLGVQRATISHLLSGRNKPSLDFVMKVLSEFEEVDLYWLLNGTGTYPKKDQNTIANTSTPSPQIDDNQNLFSRVEKDEPELEIEKSVAPQTEHITKEHFSVPQKIDHSNNSNVISKILVLYKNGSFEVFSND